MKKKLIKLLMISFILVVILVSAIESSLNGYYNFYYENKKIEKNIFEKITNEAFNITPINFFATYTGFDTGYGFFAPNVSSDFLLVFKVYDPKGRLVKTIKNVHFKSKESNLRFSVVNSMFQKKLIQNGDKKTNKYLDIIIKQISN